jgi:SAM-dependent methyltransferase
MKPDEAQTSLPAPEDPPGGDLIARITSSLRAGCPVTDPEFDELLPDDLQVVSYRFWTPARIAMRASQLLTCCGARRILDVGAGPGKVCIIGALATGAHFTGLEQRPHLVQVGNEIIGRLGLTSQVKLVHGNFDQVDFGSYEGFYFFNPFAENLFARADWLDDEVELSERRFMREMRKLEALLAGLPKGARLVTFHGLGWRIPDCFDPIHMEDAGYSRLRLWVKTKTSFSGYHADLADEIPSQEALLRMSRALQRWEEAEGCPSSGARVSSA